MASGSPYKLLSEAIMYTNVDAPEVKDLSKNLVSGDLEREYREGMMDKRPQRNQVGFKVIVLILGAVTTGLLVLAVVREFQMARLHRDLGVLSADVIAMKITIKSLSDKLENLAIEDLFPSDIDSGISLDDDDSETDKSKNPTDKLRKIQDLTDNADIFDDEGSDEIYDEDIESGDWNPDDERFEKFDKMHGPLLKDDFTDDAIVTLRFDDKKPLSKVTKMLNENPQNPAVFAVAKESLSNENEKVLDDMHRARRSVQFDAPADSLEPAGGYAAPRIVAKIDELRKTKKYRPQTVNDDALDAVKSTTIHTPSRIPRNSDDEEGSQRRPFIAAHFHGNTSHLSTEIHEHYKGNGLVRLAHDAHHSVWYPSSWTSSTPAHSRPGLTQSGHVHVKHTGVYLVYVQIYYLDSHDVISWVLHRTNPDSEGRDKLLQCAQYSPSSTPFDKPNSCFSAAALLLKNGDRLAVRNTAGERHSLMQPEKSFIGLIKLADAVEHVEEQL